MMSEENKACADLTLADAIQDLAKRTGRPQGAVRREIIETGAYDALYDEETYLWATGPEAFIDFFEKISNARQSELPCE